MIYIHKRRRTHTADRQSDCGRKRRWYRGSRSIKPEDKEPNKAHNTAVTIGLFSSVSYKSPSQIFASCCHQRKRWQLSLEIISLNVSLDIHRCKFIAELHIYTSRCKKKQLYIWPGRAIAYPVSDTHTWLWIKLKAGFWEQEYQRWVACNLLMKIFSRIKISAKVIVQTKL